MNPKDMEIARLEKTNKELIKALSEALEMVEEYANDLASESDRACGIKSFDWFIKATEALRQAKGE